MIITHDSSKANIKQEGVSQSMLHSDSHSDGLGAPPAYQPPTAGPSSSLRGSMSPPYHPHPHHHHHHDHDHTHTRESPRMRFFKAWLVASVNLATISYFTSTLTGYALTNRVLVYFLIAGLLSSSIDASIPRHRGRHGYGWVRSLDLMLKL